MARGARGGVLVCRSDELPRNKAAHRRSSLQPTRPDQKPATRRRSLTYDASFSAKLAQLGSAESLTAVIHNTRKPPADVSSGASEVLETGASGPDLLKQDVIRRNSLKRISITGRARAQTQEDAADHMDAAKLSEMMPCRHHVAELTSQLLNAHEKSNAIFTYHIIRRLYKENHINAQHRELLHAEVHQRNDDVIAQIRLGDPQTIRKLAEELCEEYDALDALDGGRKSSWQKKGFGRISGEKQRVKSANELVMSKGKKMFGWAQATMSAPSLVFGEDGTVGVRKDGTDTAAGSGGDAVHSGRRRVKFTEVNVRTHTCTFGQACPSSNGPSIGLGWELVSELSRPLDEWERKREGEGRLGMYDFQEDGSIPVQARVDALRNTGHRKLSIDLDTFQMTQLRIQRRSSARSKCAVKVMDGEDPGAVEEWERETLLAVEYRSQLREWLQRARTTIRKRNPGKSRLGGGARPSQQAGGRSTMNPLAAQRMNPLMQRNTTNPLLARRAAAAGSGGR